MTVIKHSTLVWSFLAALKKVVICFSLFLSLCQPGTCGRDGLYYMDASTFVFCSNGNAYYQPCAPGTRNSGQNKFSPGFYYGYSEFCDVNLVDFGYGAQYNGYVPVRPPVQRLELSSGAWWEGGEKQIHWLWRWTTKVGLQKNQDWCLSLLVSSHKPA